VQRNFGGAFWSSLVSFPKPIEGLVSHDVLVETFEEGESVATFLVRKGAREGGTWVQELSGQWVMRDAAEDETTAMRSRVAFVGIQTYLKMVIWDNLIHADLHPGNVLIRTQEIGPLQRLLRYVVLGDTSARVPHIVLLDAGLASSFDDTIRLNVRKFFEAIVKNDGVEYGKSILGLALSQPYVKSPEAFIEEVNAKCTRHRAEYDSGLDAGTRSGDNIREYMQSVRDHRVVLDPTVMVALMSMLVLEGWQVRLDPAVSIMEGIELAVQGGIFAYASQLTAAAGKVVDFFTVRS
jgi:aarF domain-containing kinase